MRSLKNQQLNRIEYKKNSILFNKLNLSYTNSFKAKVIKNVTQHIKQIIRADTTSKAKCTVNVSVIEILNILIAEKTSLLHVLNALVRHVLQLGKRSQAFTDAEHRAAKAFKLVYLFYLSGMDDGQVEFLRASNNPTELEKTYRIAEKVLAQASKENKILVNSGGVFEQRFPPIPLENVVLGQENVDHTSQQLDPMVPS